MNGDCMSHESHLSDQELLLAADGELPPPQAAQVATHLSQCWSCRARKQELESAIVDFVRLHRDTLDPLLPPAAGPRALLKAQLAQLASVPQPWRTRWSQVFSSGWAWREAAAALLLSVSVAVAYHYWTPVAASRSAFHSVPVSFPEASLTPGAVVTVSREQVCDSSRPKNRAVPVALQRKVFEEYGIPTAEPRSY